MASAQIDAAPVEEVVQDKNTAEEVNLPKSIEESDVVVHDHEEDELGEQEFEGEAKNFDDKENLDEKVTDSPIIAEDEPNSTFDDDDADAEEGEESDMI